CHYPSLAIATSYCYCCRSCIKSPHLPPAATRLASPSSSTIASVIAATHRCNCPAHSHILCHSPQSCTTTARKSTNVVLFFFCQPHRCWLPRLSPVATQPPTAAIPSYYHPCCCCHHPLLQPSSTDDITDLKSYAMTSVDLIGVKLEAFETHMEDKLCTLFVEFRLGQLSSPRRSQHGGSSERKENPIKKERQAIDPSCPSTRVDFPRWEDGDLTWWISRAERYFHYRRTLEASMVDIATIHLGRELLNGTIGASTPTESQHRGRSYIPILQIRMEKMKEVKHPPL
ncbi:hypothetical protein BHM03_00021234, partial [Ensete ventricosum]